VLCDINFEMIEVGRDRLLDRGIVSNIDYVQGDAEKLPFPDEAFDAITIAFGLRNVTRKEVALADMCRVLKPHGHLVVLEFSKPRNPVMRTAYNAFSALWPDIGRAITGDRDSYKYLVESIRMHPDQETLRDMIEDAGFAESSYHNIVDGVAAIHLGIKG
ncbi:MAG: ubiquinone/menaquinone biosynthesis methyltransferase, partial [Pseudomonadales bacterium]|nr:ubiquinone/menaquinone biosynthesis methyltransferase [Pseudomonadales bacterium]